MKPTVLIVVLFSWLETLRIYSPPSAMAHQPSVTDFIWGGCNTATFIPSDSFAWNLDEVVESLTQSSSKSLYNLTSSENGSDYVYGVYQCRGDISLSDCSTCVSRLKAFQSSASNPCEALVIGARMLYRGCYYRYENYTFYNGYEKDGIWNVTPKCSGSILESSPLYKQNLDTALKDSAKAAPQHPDFGYDSSIVGSGSDTAYALTQCYGYLNSLECADCLSQVSNYSNACNRSISGEVFFNGCYYVFGNNPLTVFNSTVDSPARAPLSPQESKNHSTTEKRRKHTAAIVGIVVGISAFLAMIVMLAYFLRRRKKSVKSDLFMHAGEQLLVKPGAERFSLKELEDATNNFHPSYKLGEGGFGPVYQGRLRSGMEVAIKILSTQSHQGKTEFINEVNLITTVQHRNLIKLIGYCVEDNKPCLVYEFLPNRSLDLHLFDVDERKSLDWHTRFDLIIGIVQGIKYLHEDSYVRIIHRDIKASNILLDNNFNPKIADFGLARLFADNSTHVTTRVIGTLGYLAPEYAISGQLTEKADIYSFGLVALEIVSGRRVVEAKFEDDKRSLLDWAWDLFKKKQLLEIVDKRISKTMESSDMRVSIEVNERQVIRVVHVALLCTQWKPQKRPSISEVHKMLCNESQFLNVPTKPITTAMFTPIENLLNDGNVSMLLGATRPSEESQILMQVPYSSDVDFISEVDAR